METLVKPTRSGELYRELSRMASGMPAGARMPSYLQLTSDFGVGQGVIDTAYDRLRAQGVIETRPRSGTFVANPYADALVVFVCSTLHFMPGQGDFVRQAYMALRQKTPTFFPGASVELLVIDYDPAAGIRESRIRERLANLFERYRVLGVISAFHLDCPETYDYCEENKVPLIETGRGKGAHKHTVHTASPRQAWQIGLAHLWEEGWNDRLLVSINFYDKGLPPKTSEDTLRANLAQIDGEARCEFVPVEIGANTEESGAEFAKRLLNRRSGLPDALMVDDDFFMRGMLIGAMEEGVKLADIRPLVTVSNEGIPIRASRLLTRVEYRYRAIVHEQLTTLSKLLTNETSYLPAPVPPVLIIGQSSRREDYPELT